MSSDSHDRITVALLHVCLLSPFDFHMEFHVVLRKPTSSLAPRSETYDPGNHYLPLPLPTVIGLRLNICLKPLKRLLNRTFSDAGSKFLFLPVSDQV